MTANPNDNGNGELDPLLGTRKVRAWADCTDRNLRRLIQAGKFPAPDLRLGRSLKWRRSTLERRYTSSGRGVNASALSALAKQCWM